MSRYIRVSFCVLGAVAAASMTGRPDVGAAAQAVTQPSAATPAAWDTTLARGATRDITFTTSEGTWMSVDLSSDGQWIVFDLLGHVYRVAATGGRAECLTQDTGVALNFQPRYSHDGRTIAFVSDRAGQNNLWLMDADGRNPRAVYTDKDIRSAEPVWTPDDRFLIVRRQNVSPNAEGAGGGLYMYSREGGTGVELVGRDRRGAAWPAVSPDGKWLYFHESTAPPSTWSGRADVMQGAKQVRRLELATGRVLDVTSGESVQQGQTSSGGAIAALPSPDGRWLAFARRIPDGTVSYKGHTFGPRTALWLRDLKSGAETLAMDPIEMDMAEGMKVSRDLPGYAWSTDSRTIVIAQGGHLRRLDVASGRVDTIPFTADVRRTISEMAYGKVPLTDGPVALKFPRWASTSPDGTRLAFQAVGRIWITDWPNGTPRRLTPESFEPFEMSPAWSPDGRSIAFTSWADAQMGHVWIVDANGGVPRQVTREAGEYLHTVWRPDGAEVVVTKGTGAAARGQSFNTNMYFELVRVPAAGGDVTPIAVVNRPYAAGRPVMARRPVVQAAFGPEGRLFYPETFGPKAGEPNEYTELVSVKVDGSDRRVHATLPDADEAAVSPDGAWAAVQEGDNVYLLPMPMAGTGATPVRIDKRRGRLPVTQAARVGGYQLRWRNATTLEFLSGPGFFTFDVTTRQLSSNPIALTVPRPLPTGSIALTGARIVTLENKQVIERGTVVVTAGRITCVGLVLHERRGQGRRRERQDDHSGAGGHACAPPPRPSRGAAAAQLGVGDLPGPRRDHDARQLDVVPQRVSSGRAHRSRRRDRPAHLQHGRPAVLGRCVAAERDLELRGRRGQREAAGRVGRPHDEAVHAAPARSTPVDQRRLPQDEAQGDRRRRRPRIQPQHDHGRADGLGARHGLCAHLRRRREVLRHGRRHLLTDVPRGGILGVERGVLLPGERRVARPDTAHVDAVAHARARHTAPNAQARHRLQLSR